MALVDTQGFVMAVDRSLFGPQGRRWIERKLPDVVTNLAFIGVSAVGALILCFHVSFVTRLQFCVEPHHPRVACRGFVFSTTAPSTAPLSESLLLKGRAIGRALCYVKLVRVTLYL